MHIPGQTDNCKIGVTVTAALAVAYEGEFSGMLTSFSLVIWKGRVIFAAELLSATKVKKLNRPVIQLSPTVSNCYF